MCFILIHPFWRFICVLRCGIEHVGVADAEWAAKASRRRRVLAQEGRLIRILRVNVERFTYDRVAGELVIEVSMFVAIRAFAGGAVRAVRCNLRADIVASQQHLAPSLVRNFHDRATAYFTLSLQLRFDFRARLSVDFARVAEDAMATIHRRLVSIRRTTMVQPIRHTPTRLARPLSDEIIVTRGWLTQSRGGTTILSH
jgi:hypothetical protein